MEEYKKDIAGIVIIEVDIADYDRVKDQLCKLTNVEDIQYSGILHPVHPMRACDGSECPAVFYLELEHGIWGNVVHWCSSAMGVGLIKGYRYAETGPMRSFALGGSQ